MYETLGREGEPVLAIGTKPICESDRKVHWFASENLFIRTIILCFIKFLTLFHEKQSDIVKFHVVLKTGAPFGGRREVHAPPQAVLGPPTQEFIWIILKIIKYF